jgi:hypothetical protein
MKTNFEELDTPDDSTEATTPISNSAGMTYDWTTAPTTTKAPPRINLDGKVVTVIKADIILPSESEPWLPTKKGDKKYKKCQFKLTFDIEGQAEYLSGVRVFETGGRYSHPSFTRDGANQASALLVMYAKKKGAKTDEVSLREFLGFLNSKPKFRIKVEQTKNPTTGALVNKNMPSAIVD